VPALNGSRESRVDKNRERESLQKIPHLNLKLVAGGLLLIIIGMGISGWLWCPSRIERANAITMDSIQKQGKSLETGRQMSKVGKELAALPLGSAEYEEKLNDLIDLFDPATRDYIKALPRKDRVDAMLIKLKEQRAAQDQEVAREKAKERLCWCLTFGNYDITYR
jgi:hypothetical protein